MAPEINQFSGAKSVRQKPVAEHIMAPPKSTHTHEPPVVGHFDGLRRLDGPIGLARHCDFLISRTLASLHHRGLTRAWSNICAVKMVNHM